MIKYTLAVDGMQCGMCEAHVNDVVRKNFPVKKVTSSHSKGSTEILTQDPLDEACLREVIAQTGYTVRSVTQKPYEKKGMFHF